MGQGHAWNQIQIDGKWYNVDATWDASSVQKSGGISYMLRADSTFGHDEYVLQRKKNTHTCPQDAPFDQKRFMSIVNQNRWWGGKKGGR